MPSFVKTNGDQFVLSDDESQVVKLKGSNFQTPNHPHFFFDRFDFDWVERGMSQVASLGMNCVRQVVGDDQDSHMEALAKYLAVAERYGVRVYLIPGWPHKYAEEGTLDDRENIEFIRRFVELVRDDHRVLAYDLVNEPDWISNDVWQWDQDRATAAHRLRWLRRMAEKLRELDPNHAVSAGATFSYSYWLPEEPFTLESIVDFVDFHYYRRNYRESWPGDEIRRMKSFTDKPIVVGEFGFPTDPSYSIEGEPEHNEELQVEMYARYIRDISAADIVGFLQWALTDCKPGIAHQRTEGTYGILRMDMTWKPVASLIRDSFRAATCWPESVGVRTG